MSGNSGLFHRTELQRIPEGILAALPEDLRQPPVVPVPVTPGPGGAGASPASGQQKRRATRKQAASKARTKSLLLQKMGVPHAAKGDTAAAASDHEDSDTEDSEGGQPIPGPVTGGGGVGGGRSLRCSKGVQVYPPGTGEQPRVVGWRSRGGQQSLWGIL